MNIPIPGPGRLTLIALAIVPAAMTVPWRTDTERWVLGVGAVVAVLLLATTVLIPLIELCALGWLLLPLHLGYRPAGFSRVFRALQLAHPWAMVEVFILGVLVSLVKLSHLADVLPGPAIWCFGALMLVLSVLSSIVDYRELWQTWEAAEA